MRFVIKSGKNQGRLIVFILVGQRSEVVLVRSRIIEIQSLSGHTFYRILLYQIDKIISILRTRDRYGFFSSRESKNALGKGKNQLFIFSKSFQQITVGLELFKRFFIIDVFQSIEVFFFFDIDIQSVYLDFETGGLE